MSKPLSRKKKLVFLSLILAALGGVCELVSWLALKDYRSGWITDTQEQIAVSGVARGARTEAIHPYLGWTHNPEVSGGVELGGRTIPIHWLGLVDEEWEIPKRDRSRLIVGVMGGSVAWQVTVLGEKAFKAALQKAFPHKEIVVLRLAMSGYKQPQQLIELNYLHALGAEFDVIVEIDGYNEVALAAAENENARVFQIYPRTWNARTQDIADPRVYSESQELLALRAARQNLARWICGSVLRKTWSGNYAWVKIDTYYQNKFIEIGNRLRRHEEAQGWGFASGGPKQLYSDEAGMYENLRDVWSRCSFQMNGICAANGTKYVHILQPNQYLPGSKRLDAQERADAFDDEQECGQTIARGYPILIAEGARLRERGVDFHDLTMLFSEIDEPIYVDQYCHYNERGNEILARAIAEFVIAARPAARAGTPAAPAGSRE